VDHAEKRETKPGSPKSVMRAMPSSAGVRTAIPKLAGPRLGRLHHVVLRWRHLVEPKPSTLERTLHRGDRGIEHFRNLGRRERQHLT